LRNTTPIKIDATGGLVEIVRGDFAVPVVIRPKIGGVGLAAWIHNSKEWINHELTACGAVLFRGFDINGAAGFQECLQALGGPIMEYRERSSKRSEIQDHIYTSTDHPADQEINMHNEHSCSSEWPMKIVFFCHQPSQTGGQTPIADSREILRSISAETVEKFRGKGVLYKRQLGTGFGLGWQEVFQTDSKPEAEQECLKRDMEFGWLNDRVLQVTFKRPAIRRHPVSNEEVWFNHAAFFNILSMDMGIQNVMRQTEAFPFNTFFGDGEPIQKETIDELQRAYRNNRRYFDWQRNDMLVLDNMLMAHGRAQFEGPRKIMVGMLEPISL